MKENKNCLDVKIRLPIYTPSLSYLKKLQNKIQLSKLKSQLLNNVSFHVLKEDTC